MCARDEAIAFLPSRTGAEWIVFPRKPEGTIRDGVPATVEFRHGFSLTSPPAHTGLELCAFRAATVFINGRQVGGGPHAQGNWKVPGSLPVAGLLRPGTNAISVWVTNAVGPPALWLRLKSGGFSLGTGERWEASLDGMEWRKAHSAREPFASRGDRSLDRDTRMTDLLRRAWPTEAVFCAVSVALVWGVNRWLGPRRLPGGALPGALSTRLSYGLLVMVLLARAALFLNNVPQLPPSIGFDAEGHKEYIQFIQQKHALPLADQGWEMFHPPLYYLISALVVGGCGHSVGDADAIFPLRAVNGVIGLLHCWVVFLCLRLLLVGNVPAQAAGLLVAAFLPPHLYLSQYVTNEPLFALLMTVAIYFCLRELRAQKEGLWLPAAIGVALGAAMLTKYVVLLGLPFFALALSQRLAAGRERAWREWLRRMGVIAVTFLLVCGWHYARVWARFGKPIVGNWDRETGQGGRGHWWIDPGFGTSTYYSSFGRSLVWPWFSGFHGFGDGVYSTLWGDGLASGATDGRSLRPPWNRGLEGAGIWLGLGFSLLFLLGTALVLAGILRQARGEWLLTFGIVCSYSLALVWGCLLLPYGATAKAFYASPALLPFSALVAVGWDWLRRRRGAVGSALWVLLLVWSMTAYASFWVRSGNPATRLLLSSESGKALLEQGKLDEAIGQFEEVVQVEPDYADGHINLGAALEKKGQSDEAIRQYEAALRLRPDSAAAHKSLGAALDKKGQSEEAIRHYQEAVRLKPDSADAHINLGAALDDAGRTDEAIRHYLAALRLRPDYAQAHNNLGIALGRKGRTAEGIRQFQEALHCKPDYAEAHTNLGIAFCQQGRTDEAIREFREALRLQPDSVGARQGLEAALATQAHSSPPPGASTNP
jgi:tetratricopeptide (TPR) repeat protein